MKCSNCGKEITEDQIIFAQIGIGVNTTLKQECEYCVED